ncbi:uncharacterized protein LOC128723976 [Anopheles nili]|uniref:uncharacterized protein LOC128723976 n=1 Tax=Anopheles nili TaxID=185578 RepID=UPI00237ACE9F|nr:uncharacterized protein LOC128723976 [Anopheles nili]
MFKETIVALVLVGCSLSVAQKVKTAQECVQQMPSSLKSRLCDHQSQMFDDTGMQMHLDCLMRAVGFAYANGRGDYHALYNPMNAVERDRKHDYNLEVCIGKTVRKPANDRAVQFAKCLMDSNSGQTFKKVFDQEMDRKVCKS